jgi:exonuclease SbcC
VYGPNGSGKTALISAIEFAVTGNVAHLRAYSSDYPRCLKHIRANGRTQVTLHYKSENDESLYQTMAVDDPGFRSPKPARISDVESRFFLERSYLSQSLLARLLESYQAVDKDQPEQPLVRFIRELIGLDLLENLTVGLYEAADIRRMEKASSGLVNLTRQGSAISENKDRLERQQNAESALWKEHLDAVRALIASYGDPVKDASWTAAGLHVRSAALTSKEAAEKEVGSLRRLEQLRGRLDRATGFIRASREREADDIQGLRNQLSSVDARRGESEPLITPVIELAEAVLRQAGLVSRETRPQQDIGRRIEETELMTARGIDRFEGEIKVAGETDEELKSLEELVGRLGAEIKRLEETPTSLIAQQRGRIEVLRRALDVPSGDVCPVCGRDYSELKSGDLRSRVTLELERLGIDIERLESAANRRAQLTTEEAQMRRRLIALKGKVESTGPRVEQIRVHLGELKKSQEAISSIRQVCAEWGRLRVEAETIRARLTAAEIRETQRAESAKEVSAIARELGIPEEEGPPDVELLAEKVSSHLRMQIDSIEANRTARFRLLNALDGAEAVASRLEQIGGSLRELEVQGRSVQIARENVKEALEKARLLARAASTVKKDLMQQVFNETLNGLWEDLFRRLVRWEIFTPRLSEPTSFRGKILTTIQAIADGAKPFEQAACVLSTGNLNTAALSLFLALHLVEEPRHHILVLDDPIQSMDDVHVVQLASVLRAIVREAGRQLLIAVHERALYEYLCLELGPSRPTDALLAIELSRESEQGDVAVRHERRIWKEDLVTFGA